LLGMTLVRARVISRVVAWAVASIVATPARRRSRMVSGNLGVPAFQYNGRAQSRRRALQRGQTL
ncbi:MAG: hypothetical protein WBN31_04550, partial [Gammaproteobacteria bacterium]